MRHSQLFGGAPVPDPFVRLGNGVISRRANDCLNSVRIGVRASPVRRIEIDGNGREPPVRPPILRIGKRRRFALGIAHRTQVNSVIRKNRINAFHRSLAGRVARKFVAFEHFCKRLPFDALAFVIEKRIGGHVVEFNTVHDRIYPFALIEPPIL